MLFAAGWSSCQIYFAISHSMAIRAMQDQQNEENEEDDDEDSQQRQVSGEESLPLRHALENEDEEVIHFSLTFATVFHPIEFNVSRSRWYSQFARTSK